MQSSACLCMFSSGYRYCLSLETNPFLTKACTSLVGFMLGDFLAQKLEGEDLVDMARLARLGAYGLLLDGHMWYKCVPWPPWPPDRANNRHACTRQGTCGTSALPAVRTHG